MAPGLRPENENTTIVPRNSASMALATRNDLTPTQTGRGNVVTYVVSMDGRSRNAVTMDAISGNITPMDRIASLDDRVWQSRKLLQVMPQDEPLKRARTALVEFDEAPFPYDGVVPTSNAPFLNVSNGDERGHRTAHGKVFWEKETFGDRRSLLHLPKGFDVNRPGVMIVFFHGHGATLERDVLKRQQVVAQISASGINAVLVAPQFAVDARDSSAGKFWQPGGFGKFVDEAAIKLARLQGNPAAARKFASMPIVLVAYSGGYSAAAWSVSLGGVKNRIRGIVLLDALYGELDKFATWIENSKSAFFVSAFTNSTKRQNHQLERILAERNVAYTTELKRRNWQSGVIFLSTDSDVEHRDFVTRSWVDSPIKDVLARLDEYRR